MVPASLPFTILIRSSFFGVTERRIVSELQSIFCFAIPIYRNRSEDGKTLQKALVQCLACIQARNVMDPPFTKCMDKALSVSKDCFYNSKINIPPSFLRQYKFHFCKLFNTKERKGVYISIILLKAGQCGFLVPHLTL